MSCLERFRWIKLPRLFVPDCNGMLGHWAHLAARAAYRRGIASYCGHRNPVKLGTWTGGIVSLKSILSVKKRKQALNIIRQLLDRINDALTSLKRKPDNGPLLYELIYLTYIGEEKLVLNDILF